MLLSKLMMVSGLAITVEFCSLCLLWYFPLDFNSPVFPSHLKIDLYIQILPNKYTQKVVCPLIWKSLVKFQELLYLTKEQYTSSIEKIIAQEQESVILISNYRVTPLLSICKFLNIARRKR
jgi:hypothetical protein